MYHRGSCNAALRDHPTIQVGGEDDNHCVVGLLGIINGIIEPLTGERIAASWNDDKFIGFVKYSKSVS